MTQLTLDALWDQVQERLGEDAEELVTRAAEKWKSCTPMTAEDYESYNYSTIPPDDVG